MIVTKKIEGGTANIKADITDAGGRFYVYDTFDDKGKITAKDRYTYVDGEIPFDPLTVGEIGLVKGEVPDIKWNVPAIKVWLADHQVGEEEMAVNEKELLELVAELTKPDELEK